MPDFTMCCNDKCPLKKECYRFMAVSSERQSFSKFELNLNKICTEFIKIEPHHKLTKFYGEKETK